MQRNVHLRYQIALFLCLYIGYTLYVYCRKSFSFSAAAISQDEGLLKRDLGLIASSQALAYTIGKFSSGLLVDRISPKLMFAAGLLLTGLSTLAFASCGNVWLLTLVWFINGLAGGPGWPACAKFLRTWYPASQLGTLWSALSTSMNVAGSLGPMVAMALVGQLGWRLAMSAPGIVAVVFSIISLIFLHNKPRDVGLPDIADQDDKEADKKDNEKLTSAYSIRDILTPFFIKLCIGYQVTMCIRSASLDWGQLYLIQDLGHPHITGSGFTSSQELGGIVGSLAAGYLSDKLISVSTMRSGTCRIWVVLLNSLVILIALLCMVTLVTSNSSQVLISSIGFSLGFSLYGCMALYGVTAIEGAPLELSGTAHSIVAASANVGMVMSGLPLSWVASHYQWKGAFTVLLLTSTLPVILSLSTVAFPSPVKHLKKT